MRHFPIVNNCWVLVVLLCFGTAANTYSQELSKKELEERALDYFQEGDYLKAAMDFEQLKSLFPKDNRYAYYLGRSYLDANTRLSEAVELLDRAAKRNYGDDTYFHLGRAYHRLYRFDEARHAFNTFQNTATQKARKKCDTEYWLSVIESAKKSILIAQKIEVTDMQEVPSKSPESAFIDKVNGKYVYAPTEFMTSTAQSKNYQSPMFLSREIEVGDYLYFSSLSRRNKSGVDIYRVKRLSAEDFTEPELLPEIINSAYDEAYPFFDYENSRLYFSSNNPNTTGGYDIFSAEYDERANYWKKPEKLDFPLNSVHDDVFYTTIHGSNEAIFLSTRNSQGSDFHSYSVILPQKAEYEIPADREEVMAIALLSPSAISVEQENLRLAQVAPYTPEEEKSNAAITPYDRLINEALALQIKSDSLAWMAEESKLRAVKSEHAEEKKSRVNNTALLHAESVRLQEMADQKFAEAEKLKKEEVQANSNIKPSTVTQDGLVLFSYKNGISDTYYNKKSSELKKAPSNQSEEQGKLAAANISQQLTHGFSIQAQSPYSHTNPIPETNLPEGLVYRIQLGAFSKDIPENTFGGLSPVSRENAGSSTKYYVGYFKSITDARAALQQVRDYGYPDAFIVSFYQNKKVTIQKAREIEFASQTF